MVVLGATCRYVPWKVDSLDKKNDVYSEYEATKGVEADEISKKRKEAKVKFAGNKKTTLRKRHKKKHRTGRHQGGY